MCTAFLTIQSLHSQSIRSCPSNSSLQRTKINFFGSDLRRMIHGYRKRTDKLANVILVLPTKDRIDQLAVKYFEVMTL
jgi:hypothetical protein